MVVVWEQSLPTMFTLRAGRAGSALHSTLIPVSGAVTADCEGCTCTVSNSNTQHTINMPGVITVPDFIREAKEDIASPTTSTFVNRIPQCRETINRIDEVENVRL